MASRLECRAPRVHSLEAVPRRFQHVIVFAMLALAGALSVQVALAKPLVRGGAEEGAARPRLGPAPLRRAIRQGPLPPASNGAATWPQGAAPRLTLALALKNASTGALIASDDATMLDVRAVASTGWDAYDATKLSPLSNPSVTLALHGMRGTTRTWQAVRSLPEALVDSLEIPLRLRTSQGGRATLSWSGATSLPASWKLTLIDRTNGTRTDLRTDTPATADLAGATDDSTRFALSVVPASALPVELTTFRVAAEGADAVLRWTTASETGNAGYAVEVRAAGASPAPWRAVGFVPGSGTTTEARAYEHRVTHLEAGAYRFRLRQMDLDGSAHLTAEVAAVVGLDAPYVLSELRPNPARAAARLRLVVRAAQPVHVGLYDALGRAVSVLYTGMVAEAHAVEIPVATSALPEGMYVVRVTGERFTATRTLTVVR